jgi:hypothetical protein
MRGGDQEQATAGKQYSCDDHPEPTRRHDNAMPSVLFSTLVSEADTIHTPAIKTSKKATSATLTPVLCEKARSPTSRRC